MNSASGIFDPDSATVCTPPQTTEAAGIAPNYCPPPYNIIVAMVVIRVVFSNYSDHVFLV